MCVPVEDKGGGRDRGIEKLHGASTSNTWIRARERGRERKRDANSTVRRKRACE